MWPGPRRLLGAPCRLDPASALSEPPSDVEVGGWLYRETVTQRYGPPAIIAVVWAIILAVAIVDLA
jgi:hypothetical protein